MQLNEQSEVLDLGCGKAELLTRIAEAYGCQCVGVDSNSSSLSLARQPSRGVVNLVEADMTTFIEENKSEYDGILCIGSIREGQQESTIAKLSSFLKSRGQTSCQGSCLLIGELVWVHTPSAEFLAHMGIEQTAYCTLDQLTAMCQSNGLEVVLSTSQSLEEYETRILQNIEHWGSQSENASDPDYDVIMNRSRSWHSFSKEHAWKTWEFATLLVRAKHVKT